MNQLLNTTKISLLAIINDVRRLGTCRKKLILPGVLGLFMAVLWSPSFAATPVELMKRVNDNWQQNVVTKEELADPNRRDECRWNDSAYQIGNLAAYRTTSKEDYLEYSETYAKERCAWDIVRPKDRDEDRPPLSTHPDDQAAGNIYLELLAEPTSDIEVDLDELFKSIHKRMDAPLDPPDSLDNKVYEWKAVDWIFMAGPVFSKLGKLCAEDELPPKLRKLCDGDEDQYKVTRERNPYWDTMFELYEHARKLQGLFFSPTTNNCDPKGDLDDDSGLWWRDISRKKCKIVWGRGNGWVMAAIPRMLEHLPSDYGVKIISDDVKASKTQDPNFAANTIDNDLNTRWSCLGKDNCSIWYDLGSEKTLDRVEIAWYRGDQRNAFFDLESSEDAICFESPENAEWKTILKDASSSGASLDPESFDFENPDKARCIRYVGDGNSDSDWNSITEFRVVGPIRAQLIDMLDKMARVLKPLQRTDDGFWNPALLDPILSNSKNSESPETSGTAFFTYGIAWGINNKHLRRDIYLPVAMKAWTGMEGKALAPMGEFDKSELGYIQEPGAQPPGDKMKRSDTADKDLDDPKKDTVERLYGIGAFLLAGSEIANLLVDASDSQDPNIPEKTIDNDLNTRWSCQGRDGCSIWYDLYDLGSERELKVRAVGIAWYRGDERTASFDLKSSEDFSCFADPESAGWKTIFNNASSSGDSLALEIFKFPTPERARCIRYVGRGNSANSWNSITEFQIFPKRITPINFEASKTQDPNFAANTIDNDLNTRWSCLGKDNCSIWYDLGSEKTLDRVEIAWYRGDQRNAFFDLESSEDAICFESPENAEWKTILKDASSSGASLDPESFDFENPDKARCIRYVGDGNSDSDWNSITEFRFYVMD